jgi:P27 family predicted phage terminase small subunit
MNTDLKAPKDLSRDAKRLWQSLRDEYGIRDTAGLTLLTDACRFFQRREDARELILKDGQTTKNRFGEIVAHPSVRIERDSAAAMVRSLKALNLDIEPLRDKPGRPPGR